MLKGRGDSASRKPRLFVDSADAKADGNGDDPIAAALAARKRKQEQALKAAAAAAAKAAAANVITYFADDTPVKPKQEDNSGSQVPTAGDKRPEVTSNGLSEQQQPRAEEISSPAHPTATSSVQAEAQDGGNPLASLLGYSGDDGSGSEAGDDTPERDAPDGNPEQQPASDENDSSIDAELANFMEELESSGLLKEDSAMEEPGNEGQPSASAAPSQPILAATSTPPDANHGSPAAAAAAVPASAEHVNIAESLADAALDASKSTEPDQDSAAAEQRVLGALTGCPGWHEVMDMASGKVYFWNEETDEVAWEPPAGSQPRTEGENEAVFAAAHASSEASAAARESTSAPADNKTASLSAAELPSGMESGTAEAGGEDVKLEREDGELEGRPADILMPDEAVEKAARDLLAQSWAAAEQLCGPAPLLVRLAVEAEVRLRDWQALAAAQRSAAEAGSAAGSLSWGSYQSKVQAELELLQGALPGALQEAQAASASASAAVAAAAQQAEDAAQEDGEVPAETDAQASPPLPVEPQTAPADDTAMDMDTTEDVAPPKASATASMPSAAQPVSAATSAVVSAPVASTPQPSSQSLHQVKPAAADSLTAQINSRIAAAAAAHPAVVSAHSVPSASAALPRPMAPFLAPLPALAPQWPGYYQPPPPYAYPHMPYPYMPYPMPYAAPQMPQAASAPLPASTSQPIAPGEVPSVPESAPPLPLEEQPPLPSSAPEAAPPAASAAAPAKQREYRAEPVRVATPPTPAEPPDQAPAAAAAAAAAAAPEEESRKRKLKRGAAAPAKKRAAVKVGSLAPSVLNKWAAARKDLEDKEEGEEEMDAEAAERRRMREAEEWRLKQLRSGVSSQANSNFQPLAMDWREKIKAAKGRPAEAPKAAPVKAQPKKYTSKPDLEALSGGLPPGWKALWDKQSGEIYYGNPTTKETSWEKPE